MNRAAAGARWTLATALVSAVASCNTLPNPPHDVGECGVALAIWLRHPHAARYEYFTVDGGVFGYGAGRDALILKTSWQTDLSREQCEALCEIARQGGWFNSDFKPPRAAEGDLAADCAVTWNGGQQQFVVQGVEKSVQDATAMLRMIADVRFAPALDRLPEAGLQKP
ncbi:MAG: hypothetical protein EXS17_06910 [Phycisphaerales bacterium]|nr:hypothetical protein [Phycisphaerales bacterium]